MPFRSRIPSAGRASMRTWTSARRWGGGALALAAAAVVAGCGNNINNANTLDPQGPIAAKEAGLWWLILGISTVVFIGVISVLLWSIIRYRARPDSPAPVQSHGNTRLEIAWTLVPSLVLFGILAATISTMFALQQPANAKNVVTVNAIGHQWWWEFQYPNQNFVTADEMHVPVNTVVHINLISDNVIHSFWVPELGGKTDVIPGHNNSMWLQASKPGEYRGECAEFCGAQHAHMDFLVVAQSSSDYQAWVNQEQNNAQQPTAQLEQQGLKVFQSMGCTGCHVIDGVNTNKAAIGPNLTHFGGRELIAGGVLSNTPSNLKVWIHDAQAVKPGVDMPSFTSITPDQLNALVAYLESLK